MLIHKTRIIGTCFDVYSAWEPSSYAGDHATVMRIDGQVMGQVGTLRIPKEIDALPSFSMERDRAVRAWYSRQHETAYAAIISEHREAADGCRRMGEIEVVSCRGECSH